MIHSLDTEYLPAPLRPDFESDADFRQAWLAWRRSGIGSSDVAVVCGQAPEDWGTPVSVWADKRGLTEEREPTIDMRIGSFMEPFIAAEFSKETGIELVQEQLLCRSNVNPFMIASIDRVTADGRIVELKWSKRHLDDDPDNLHKHWSLQVQHQMEVLGTDLAYLAALAASELHVFEIARDQEMIDAIIEIERNFWQHVLSGEPPTDLRPSDASRLGAFFRNDIGFIQLGEEYEFYATQWKDLGPMIKEMDSQRDIAKAKLVAALGDVNTGYLPGGRIVKKSIANIAARISPVKAHTRTTISVKDGAR